MINVQKKTIKSVDQYRHNIKLLKYHLKKEKKTNDKLRYEAAKSKYKTQPSLPTSNNRVYQLSETVRVISSKLKSMGLLLQDLFRMADSHYAGEINKQQFMKVVSKLSTDLNDSLFIEMFYAIDTSLNGLISQDEFLEFSIAYGGCADPKQIRKLQKNVKTKLIGLIVKKYQSLENFLSKFKDPIPVQKLGTELKDLGLNNNEQMVIIKTFDPSHEGSASHKLIRQIMSDAKVKTQKEQEEQQFTKTINDLCVIFRDKKINPMIIFEEADVDGKEGVSSFELQQAFQKILPDQTMYQIKKWVSLINFNHDLQITKEEYLNSIRGFYTINQIDKFTDEFYKKHPQKKSKVIDQLQPSQEAVETTIKKLSIAIEDKGMGKKQAFSYFDFNKSNSISKQELFEGLKSLGINLGLIANVMSVFNLFNKDGSQEIQMDQWLRILGEDVEMSDFDELSDLESNDQKKKKQVGKKQEKGKQIKKQVKKQNEEKIKNSQNKNPNEEKKKKELQNNTKNPKQKEKETANKGIKQSKNMDKRKEDQNKNVPNKNTKKAAKKQEEYLKDNQDSEEVGKRVQMQIAVEYKKKGKSFLSFFQQYDVSKKGIITLRNFSQALKKYDSAIPDSVIQQIFMQYCLNESEIRYGEWLDEIGEKYAADVQLQFVQTKQDIKTKIGKNKKIAENREQDQAADVEPQFKQMKQDIKTKISKDRRKQENPKGLNMDLINNLIPMLQKKQKEAEEKKKRGENIEHFEVLNNLQKEENQDNNSQRYKLIDYITEPSLIKLRDILLQKAEKIKKSKKNYEDKDFPPNQKSILKDNKIKCGIKNHQLLQWKHFKEFYKNPSLFKGQIDPSDIKQGQLGDCYFLSSLAGLAEYKNLIQRLFQYSDVENGYFLVWLCIDGLWKLIQLDGYFPIWPNANTPAFSHSIEEQLWVCLLEKAYAKCYGDYNKIIGGQPYQAIKDLTGGPGNQFNFDKHQIDQIWKTLDSANQRQLIMTAGTKVQKVEEKVEGHDENITKSGIVLGHAYSILDCQQVDNERILKLRNPWGQFQWEGDGWSDKGDKWTKQMKKKLNYQIKQNDGIFWITLQQFYVNFMSCSVNYIFPNYHYRSNKLDGVQQFMVQLPIETMRHAYVMVSHKDHRHQGLPINTPYDGIYSLLPFIQKEGSLIEKFEQKKFFYEREGHVEFSDLQKYPKGAKAYVLVNLFKSTSVTVGVYSSAACDFSIQANCLSFIEKIAFSDEDGPKSQTHQNIFKAWQSSVQGFVFLCFKNISPSALTLKVKMENVKNLKILPPFSAQNTLKIKSKQIASIKMKIMGNPYQYSYGIST